MTEEKRIDLAEYATIRVEVLDKELCRECPDFYIYTRENHDNDEIMYRRYECAHVETCKRVAEEIMERK